MEMEIKWGSEPIDIEMKRVRIRTLTESLVPELAANICDPEGWYSKSRGITEVSHCESFLKKALNNFQFCITHPVYCTVGSEMVGTTRFKRFDSEHRCLEIGGTWIAPHWRRTFVNTEVKLGLLEYCFNHLKANRVEFRIEESNIYSQRAILRQGAKFEVRMRSRIKLRDGFCEDVLIYSFIRPEWEETKKRLISLLEFDRSR